MALGRGTEICPSLSSINSHYSSAGGYPEVVIYRPGMGCENGARELLEEGGKTDSWGGGGFASLQTAGGSGIMTGYGDLY